MNRKVYFSSDWNVIACISCRRGTAMIIFFWMKKKRWKKCLITKSIFLSWKFGENGVTRKWNVKYKDSNVWFETLYIIYIIRNWNDFEIQRLIEFIIIFMKFAILKWKGQIIFIVFVTIWIGYIQCRLSS